MTVEQRVADFFAKTGVPFLRSVINNLEARFPLADMDVIRALNTLLNPQEYPVLPNDVVNYGHGAIALLIKFFADPVASSSASSAPPSAGGPAVSLVSAAPVSKFAKAPDRVSMDLTEDSGDSKSSSSSSSSWSSSSSSRAGRKPMDESTDEDNKLLAAFGGASELLGIPRLQTELPVFRNFVIEQRRKHDDSERERVASAKARLAAFLSAAKLDSKDSGVAAKVSKSAAASKEKKAPKPDALDEIAQLLDSVDALAAGEEEESEEGAVNDEEKEPGQARKRKTKQEREQEKLQEDTKLRPLTLQSFCQFLIKEQTISTILPGFAALAHFALSLFLHSADCERGFSLLKTIKTYLRNRLKNESLLPLMLIAESGPAMHDPSFPNLLERFINLWGTQKTRRVSV